MNDVFDVDDAATPLTPDEKDGLILTHIALRSELNEMEQLNIINAERWALSTKHKELLSVPFLKTLHAKMLGDVWEWAGEFRKTEKNIGLHPYKLETEVYALLDDTKYWIENETYPLDEIAIRFHHRLVFIHPFPNGNGRHGRLIADMLIMRLGGERFTWGRNSINPLNETRYAYVGALKAADNGDVIPLLKFART